MNAPIPSPDDLPKNSEKPGKRQKWQPATTCFFHRTWIGALSFTDFAKAFAKCAMAAAGMAVVLFLYAPLSTQLSLWTNLPKISGQITLAFVVFAGATTYFIIAYYLKAEGMNEIIPKLRRRLKI